MRSKLTAPSYVESDQSLGRRLATAESGSRHERSLRGTGTGERFL